MNRLVRDSLECPKGPRKKCQSSKIFREILKRSAKNTVIKQPGYDPVLDKLRNQYREMLEIIASIRETFKKVKIMVSEQNKN